MRLNLYKWQTSLRANWLRLMINWLRLMMRRLSVLKVQNKSVSGFSLKLTISRCNWSLPVLVRARVHCYSFVSRKSKIYFQSSYFIYVFGSTDFDSAVTLTDGKILWKWIVYCAVLIYPESLSLWNLDDGDVVQNF